MALEQTINRSQKSTGGIIGSTRRKQYVALWELIHHEMLAITNLHREVGGINAVSYDLQGNRNFSSAMLKSYESNLQAIINVIERTENPVSISTTEPKLHNIQTREIMTEGIQQPLLNVQAIGQAAYDKFRKERFVHNTVRYSEPIHRTKLMTFSSLHSKAQQSKIGPRSLETQDRQMLKLIEVAKCRGRKMEELLQYELSSSCSLFDTEGLMTKATKSILVIELEKYLMKDDTRIPELHSLSTGYIFDVMATV